MAKGTIDAAEFGAPVKVFSGRFSAVAYGDFVGTIQLQRASGLIEESDLAAGDWAIVETATADSDYVKPALEEGSAAWYRIGFSAHTSGSAAWEILQVGD